MVLRVSKKIGILFLSLFLLLSLSSCLDDLKLPELNLSSNGQVNVVYQVLDQVYYEELPLNLTKINTLEELFKFTDPYTYIYKDNSRDIEIGEEYYGLGITITDHNLGLLITGINDDLGVDEELYVGDIITEVNNTSIQTLEFNDKTSTLKGEKDEILALTIRRNNENIVINRKISLIPFNSITYKLLDFKIGYIKIHRFGVDTATKFKEALEGLEQTGMTTLIIDVRNNGGGYLDAVKEILECFIVDDEPYLYLNKVKDNEKTSYYSPLKELKEYNVIALVNGGSASASEVLAGTLFKYGFDVFGEKTYGKDVFQVGIALGEVSSLFEKDDILNVTMGYWLLNDETRVTGGLMPTITHVQTGLLALEYPTLMHNYQNGEYQAVVYQMGEANKQIATYQFILNTFEPFYYQPGLFELSTKNALIQFQTLNLIEVTGILDVRTQMGLISSYRTLIKDDSYDNQLKGLYNYIKENEN